MRGKIVARGVRGINGLMKSFRIMDDDSSGELSRQEFAKALNDYRILNQHANQQEFNRLFELLDRDGSNSIDYEEFVRAIVGEMNDARRTVVTEAFRKFDADGNGSVGIEDIKRNYSAAQHPEVRAGRKTEEEVYIEFLDTFEQHYSLKVSLRLPLTLT